MAAKLRDGVDAEIFKSLCDDLLMANLQETYNAARDAIHQFINKKPERGFLKTWVDWWDHRRTFIFRAFNPSYAPKMNLAEVVHASWAHRDRPNMSLLDVAQADTRDSILLEAQLDAFENGSFKGGKVPPSQNGAKRPTAKKLLGLRSWARKCQHSGAI